MHRFTGTVCAAGEHPEAPGSRSWGVRLAGGSSVGSLSGSSCPFRFSIGCVRGAPGEKIKQFRLHMHEIRKDSGPRANVVFDCRLQVRRSGVE